MKYLFPFRLVPRGSKIVLFGAGDAGRDFFLQLHELGDYCTLLAWTATSFKGSVLEKPFDYVENIPSYDFDYVVLATVREDAAAQMKESLRQLRVPDEKIIWAPIYYTIGGAEMPVDRELVLRHPAFYAGLLDRFRASGAKFGLGKFYQGFERLGIQGLRNTEPRLKLFRLKEYLKETDEVLDVGCNCGFFLMHVAEMTASVTGYDIDPGVIGIANYVRDYLCLENATFLCGNYFDGEDRKRYDVVFALAMHRYVIDGGLPVSAFAARLRNSLRPGGLLFLESHLQDNARDDYFYQIVEDCLENGMRMEYKKFYRRELAILRKEETACRTPGIGAAASTPQPS